VNSQYGVTLRRLLAPSINCVITIPCKKTSSIAFPELL